MAIFHYSIKIVKRSAGESAIAAAAYQSRSRIKDEETGKVHDYSRRKDLVYKEIMLCSNAPSEYRHRKTLWAAVQETEKAANAQLARRIEIALPTELNLEEQIELVRSYVQKNFVDKGMCADICIHHPDKDPPNPHIHILLTLRGIREDGTWEPKEQKVYELDADGNRIPVIDPRTGKQKVGKGNRKQWKRIVVKANDWNNQDLAEEWRCVWAESVNEYMKHKGLAVRIDHRSFERQGIDKIPTQHEGTAARKMEKAGTISERCEENRNVRRFNQSLESSKADIAELEELMRRKEQVDERARRLLQGRASPDDGGVSADQGIGAGNAFGEKGPDYPDTSGPDKRTHGPDDKPAKNNRRKQRL